MRLNQGNLCTESMRNRKVPTIGHIVFEKKINFGMGIVTYVKFLVETRLDKNKTDSKN